MSDSDFDDPDFGDPDYGDPDFGYKPPREAMSGCAKLALGCGFLLVIGAILFGIGVWWVAANARNLAADAAAAGMKGGLEELKLPADQERRIFDRIDEVARQFKEKEITLEEVGAIFKEISQGPLIPAGMVLVVERAYLDESGFDEDEKAAARITIQRFTHGAVRKMIPQRRIDAVLDTISEKKNNRDERKFKHPISDEELRTFVTEAKQAADDAKVPDEVPEVNFADEFDKAIDEALGAGAA